MIDKRRQAFIAWMQSPDCKVTDETSKFEAALATWYAACEWMAQPPQPAEGALVLDGEFFKRK